MDGREELGTLDTISISISISAAIREAAHARSLVDGISLGTTASWRSIEKQ